jgi:23S rRNA U2552 (ribose-2'-O)-methylase RlmE/FtsJ
MVQIDHTVPKEAMYSDYPYVSGTTKTLPEHFRESSARITDAYHVGERDLVVDIGSNDGTWLMQYAQYRCRVLGVEPAANVARIAQNAGVPTLNRFFDDKCANRILADYGPAKLITAAGVFFHLEELHSVVRGVAALLASDGVLVVQAIYLGDMVENSAFDQIYHEHLCYYTLRSLSALLERHGLEVFETNLLAIHGGTIEVHAARKGSRAIGGSVRRLHAAEADRRLDDVDTYRRFGERILALRVELCDLLAEYRSRGRSVWAYGAPAKGATLLNTFGIGSDLVQKAVEKNPLKIGLAIPGVRIPIEDEVGQRPDAYLVLAWNFIAEFLQKERDWLASGGEFIIPIPEVKVIGANPLT